MVNGFFCAYNLVYIVLKCSKIILFKLKNFIRFYFKKYFIIYTAIIFSTWSYIIKNMIDIIHIILLECEFHFKVFLFVIHNVENDTNIMLRNWKVNKLPLLNE